MSEKNLITLKVKIISQNNDRTMRFGCDISIGEILREIREKMGEGGADHGLFQPEVPGRSKPRWLKDKHSLRFYDIQSGAEVEYKKKHRQLRVKLSDGTTKTVLIDDSLNVAQITEVVCSKININNPEEFSLRLPGAGAAEWLNSLQPLHEQGVKATDELLLEKKFFYTDANIDRNDPVQLHLVYVQAKQSIVSGTYPTQREEAIDLACMQLQIENGNFKEDVKNPKATKLPDLKDFLAKQWHKKITEKDIIASYKKLSGISEVNAKYRYVQVVRSLKTYGISFYTVKEKGTGKKKGKQVDVLIGITREKILRMDYETKEVIKEYPLTHLKRWAATGSTFTFDFGDYEDDYLTLLTKEGEAISQQIAGYIDIILKARQDAVKNLVEDDADTATEETVAFSRGLATSTQVTSYTPGMENTPTGNMVMHTPQMGNPGSAKGGQGSAISRMAIPESQKVNVIDLKSAHKATSLLADELSKGIEGWQSSSTLSAEQWKDQLANHAGAVDKGVADLIKAASVDPNAISVTHLNDVSKKLTSEMMKLASAARNCVKTGGVELSVVDGAKAVAEAIAELLQCTDRLANSPHDPKTRADLEKANLKVQQASMLLHNAMNGNLVDPATQELISQAARALSDNVKEVVGTAKASLKSITDGVKMRTINNQNKIVSTADDALLNAARILAPVIINPKVKAHMIEASKGLAELCASLNSSVKSANAAEPFQSSMGKAAKNVNDALSQLVGALECAELKSVSGDTDFGVPHKKLVTAMVALKAKPDTKDNILTQIKTAVAATNDMVASAKRIAAANEKDPETKERLLRAAKNAADSVGKLVASAKLASQKPGDPASTRDMLDAATRLEVAAQTLVSDAGKAAAVMGLRHHTKKAAATAIKLNSAIRQAVPHVADENTKKSLSDDEIKAEEALGQLLAALAKAAKDPDGVASQNQLLTAAQKAVFPLSTVVATAKRCIPSVNNPNKKQGLNFAANDSAEAIQALMNACKSVSDIDGNQEIEEALEQFEATNADLDAAEFAAQNGFLKAGPGQTREDSLALLAQSVGKLREANNKVAAAAQGKGGKVGDAAKTAAAAASTVGSSVKTVAGTTNDKQTQKRVLGQAKTLNKGVTDFISAARALSSNKNDPSLSRSLEDALASVNSALDTLLAAAQGLDARECDEAIASIQREAGKLKLVGEPSGGGPKYKQATGELQSSTKALNAAVSSLIATAKNNPKQLGAASKMVAATAVNLINAANAAAAAAPDRETAEKLLESVRALADQTVRVINSAKMTAAAPDNQSFLNDLLGAARGLSEQLQNMISSSGGSASPECDSAANRIMNLVNGTPDVNAMARQEVLEECERAAQALANASTKLVGASRAGSAKLGQHANACAESVEAIMNAAAAAGKSPASSDSASRNAGAAQLGLAADKIMGQADVIIGSANEAQKVVGAAKQIAVSASQLIGTAKRNAQALNEDKPKQQALLKAAHGLATATSKLARTAQAAKSAEEIQQLVGSARDLKQRTAELKSVMRDVPAIATAGDVNEGVDPVIAKRLQAAGKTVAMSTAQLIRSSAAVASNSADRAASDQLSGSSKALSDAIQDLLGVCQALNPAKAECDITADAIQAAVSELDAALLQSSIGGLSGKAPPGKSHQDCQEELVNICRELASGITGLVDGTRKGPGALAASAQDVRKNIPVLVQATLAAASTTADPKMQRDLLGLSKELADSMLSLVRACRDVNATDKSTHQNLIEQSRNASQSIGKLVTALKTNVVLLKELDNAVGVISASINALDQPAQPSGRSYGIIKTLLSKRAMGIAESSSKLNSIDKTNIGALGMEAKTLGDAIPQLIEIARDAIASTAEAEAKGHIKETVKGVASATIALIDSAKKAGADPKNRQNVQVVATSYKATSQAIAQLLAAVKKGATGEILIDRAIEGIGQAANKLATASIYASAGQLEADAQTKAQSVADLQNALANVSQGLAQTASKLSDVSSMAQEDVGKIAAQVAQITIQMSGAATKAASRIGDSVAQQNLLAAAKQLATSAQQLVSSAKESNNNPTDNAASQALTEAVDEIGKQVTKLLETSKSSSAEAARGERELENAKMKIQALIRNTPDDPKATAVDVINGARDITQSVATLVFALNQEEIVNGAKQALAGTRDLLIKAKGSGRLSPKPEVRKQLIDTATAVANSMMSFLEVAKCNRQDPSNQTKLEDSSTSVTMLMSNVVAAVNLLPNTNLRLEEGDDLEAMAETELMAAAKVIENAAKTLSAARPEKKVNVDGILGKDDITDAILEAARAIAMATGTLVIAAASAQKERVAANRATGGRKYKNDPTWANGLISASKSVAGAVQMLVKASNAAAQGHAEEEALVAAAKSVAASTAQLVSASRAKADPNSQAQKKLGAAAKQVTAATGHLVKAAQKAAEFLKEEEELNDDFTMTGSKVQELEQQMKILKLEKDLENARKQMFKMRNVEYRGGPKK